MIYNRANLKTLYGLLGTVFADNTTEDISEEDFRQFAEDLIDSLGNITDDVPIRYGGNWAFPAGAFPTATYAGTMYIATADKGSVGDPDYVQAGTRFMSTVNGANTYAQFTYW
jgi:hypothetical protein